MNELTSNIIVTLAFALVAIVILFTVIGVIRTFLPQESNPKKSQGNDKIEAVKKNISVPLESVTNYGEAVEL